MSTATNGQSRYWSRHASQYDEVFLDPFVKGVENPIVDVILAVEDPETKTVADLGCGTGPLLPLLVDRFAEVVALDFAPGMIARAQERLGSKADRITFLTRPMDQLEDRRAHFDLIVAVNSLVMPDVREIDRTLQAIRAGLRPGGQFLGIVPAMDGVHYQTMLLMDRALEQGRSPREAERMAAAQVEHSLYDFAIGRFAFQGLRQKFWQPFEIEHRFRKAGFHTVELAKVLYPWDDNLPGGTDLAGYPPTWDWSFFARP